MKKIAVTLGAITPFIMFALGLLVYDQIASVSSMYNNFLESTGYYQYIYEPRCVRWCPQNWPRGLVLILLVGIPGFLSYKFVYRHWSVAEQAGFMQGLRVAFFVFMGLFLLLPVLGALSLLF